MQAVDAGRRGASAGRRASAGTGGRHAHAQRARTPARGKEGNPRLRGGAPRAGGRAQSRCEPLRRWRRRPPPGRVRRRGGRGAGRVDVPALPDEIKDDAEIKSLYAQHLREMLKMQLNIGRESRAAAGTALEVSSSRTVSRLRCRARHHAHAQNMGRRRRRIRRRSTRRPPRGAPPPRTAPAAAGGQSGAPHGAPPYGQSPVMMNDGETRPEVRDPARRRGRDPRCARRGREAGIALAGPGTGSATTGQATRLNAARGGSARRIAPRAGPDAAAEGEGVGPVRGDAKSDCCTGPAATPARRTARIRTRT